MSKAISLHVGMNRIDAGHYGTSGALAGCVNDAKGMREIALQKGFTPTLMTNEQATSGAVLGFIDGAATELRAGDTLLVTYAGHGSQVPDKNHDEAPNDKDQTWCTFDRMIVDDELAEVWSKFCAGVRIVVVSDSCHSATVARQLETISAMSRSRRGAVARSIEEVGPLIGEIVDGLEIVGYRSLPIEAKTHANEQSRDLYDSIQRSTRGTENVDINATVLTLSACLDEETAADGSGNGLYTSNLLRVWNSGRYAGTYRDFQNEIARAVGTRQHPQYKIIGGSNAAFEREQPFTVAGAKTQPVKAKEGEKKMASNENGSLDDRLAALKTGSRQYAEPSNGDVFCRMELTVPRQFIDGLNDQDVYAFLCTDGADTLMKAVLASRSISTPRGDFSGGIDCRVDHEGRVSCGGGISVRF